MESEAHQKPSLSLLQGFYTGPTIASRAPFKPSDAGEPDLWAPAFPDARKRRGGDQLGGSWNGSTPDEAEPLLPQRNAGDAVVHLESGDRPRQMDRSASERNADHLEAPFSPPPAMPNQVPATNPGPCQRGGHGCCPSAQWSAVARRKRRSLRSPSSCEERLSYLLLSCPEHQVSTPWPESPMLCGARVIAALLIRTRWQPFAHLQLHPDVH